MNQVQQSIFTFLFVFVGIILACKLSTKEQAGELCWAVFALLPVRVAVTWAGHLVRIKMFIPIGLLLYIWAHLQVIAVVEIARREWEIPLTSRSLHTLSQSVPITPAQLIPARLIPPGIIAALSSLGKGLTQAKGFTLFTVCLFICLCIWILLLLQPHELWAHLNLRL